MTISKRFVVNRSVIMCTFCNPVTKGTQTIAAPLQIIILTIAYVWFTKKMVRREWIRATLFEPILKDQQSQGIDSSIPEDFGIVKCLGNRNSF